MFPGLGYLHPQDGVVRLWHLLVHLYIWLTISSCCGSIPLTLGLIERGGGLNSLVSQLQVCLSAEGAINVSWPWLSLIRGWGSLTMAFTSKFIYIYIIYIYYRQIDRQIDRLIDRQIARQIDRQIDRLIDRQTDRETNRQIDRQTDRQIDRQIDRSLQHESI